MIMVVLKVVKWICWVGIMGGLLFIFWKRNKPKYVSLKEIVLWANEHKGEGTNVYISRLSIMPSEIRKQVQREVGGKKILNGYRDEASIFATILDADKQVVTSWYFLGNQLDEELIIALGDKTGINIEL